MIRRWSISVPRSDTRAQTNQQEPLYPCVPSDSLPVYAEGTVPETTATNFGEVLRAWFARNEWPQMVAEQVARAKGSKIGPWASQMSNAMQGKLEPKPPFFVALGWFNQVVMERDFVGITDRRLIDRLLQGQPLTHDDGQPFTAVDFFALYIGDLAEPTAEAPKPEEVELTQENVDHFWSEMKAIYRELVVEMMIGPPAVWAEVTKLLLEKGVSPDEIDWAREVFAGVRTPTLDECNRQRWKHPEMPLVTTLTELKMRSGGNQERLGKFSPGSNQPSVTQYHLSSCM